MIVRMMLLVINNDNSNGGNYDQQKQIAYPNHNDVDVCCDDNVDGG